MATRNGVEVRFTADNSDLLRAIKQNTEAFGDMRRRVDQDLNAIDTSVRQFTRSVNTEFDGLNNTLRTTGTRLEETARRLNDVGDEADRAARQVRDLDSALAGLARFGAISIGGVGTVGTVGGIPTVIPGGVFGGPTAFTAGGVGGAAAAAAAAAGGAAFRGGPPPQVNHIYNMIGAAAPVGSPAAISPSANLAGAAAIGAAGAFPRPQLMFRDERGRFMSAAAVRAATGQGEIIEEDEAAAAYRAAMAAGAGKAGAGDTSWLTRTQQAMREDEEARRRAGGLPDPDGPERFGGGLLWSLGALGNLGGAFRGPFRGSIIAGGSNDLFANPLTGEPLLGADRAQAFWGRSPVDIYPDPSRMARGLPDPSSPDYDRRYGAGLGGFGGGAALGGSARAAGEAIKGIGAAAAIAGGAVAAGLAVGIAAAIALKDNAEAAVQAFVESEQSQFRMEFAFEAAGLGEYTDAIKEWNTERAKVIPFDDDTLASAEGILARTFGTPDELKRYTNLVADVAAVTGRDLNAVASAFVKFRTSGSGRIFSELGIDIRGVGDEVLTAEEAFALLEERVGGAAEALGQTAGGQLEILDNRLGEVQETIGEKLIPTWTDFRTTAVEAAEGILEKLGEFSEAAEDAGIDTDGLKDSFGRLGQLLQGELSDAWQGLLGWVEDNREEINDFLGDVAYFVDESGPALKEMIKLVGDQFENTARLIMLAADSIRSFMEWYDQLPGSGPVGFEDLGPRADSSGARRSTDARRGGGTSLEFHSGGVVPGPPGTEYLATVLAGETVLPPGVGVGSMRPIMIYTSGSRYQRVLLEDFAHAARGQGLQVVVK